MLFDLARTRKPHVPLKITFPSCRRSCYSCAVGKYSSTRATSCIDCIQGVNYADSASTSYCKTCSACAPGWSLNSPCTVVKNAVCLECSAGRFSTDKNQQDCVPCTTCLAQARQVPSRACLSYRDAACVTCPAYGPGTLPCPSASSGPSAGFLLVPGVLDDRFIADARDCQNAPWLYRGVFCKDLDLTAVLLGRAAATSSRTPCATCARRALATNGS